MSSEEIDDERSHDSLGQIRNHYAVIAHTLPQTTGIDGVLGLDFFQNLVLTLDFQKGDITLGSNATP